MRLWMNTRQGTYGLQQEPGYADIDTKAVDFTLAKDLRISVADLPSQPVQSRQNAQADPNMATLQFQPDGFIGEGSPRSVVIKETTGETLWITQSRNRLNYEIQTQSLQNAYR